MIKKVALTLFSRLSNVAVTLGIAVVVSKSMGAVGRGDQALILLGITLVCLFTQVAGGTALVYLTPRFPGKRLLSVAYSWILTSGIFGWLVLYLIGVLDQYAIDILFISIIHSIWSANAFYLLGKEKTGTYNFLNFIYLLVILANLSINWYFGNSGLENYVNSLYLGHTVSLVFSFFALRGQLEGEKSGVKFLLGKFLHHGGFSQLANVAQLLKYRIHLYIIMAYIGPKELGIYVNAIALAEGVWIISRSIAIVQFSKVANEKSDQESRKITLQYTWISVVLSAVAMAVLMFIPDAFFTWIFGKDFTGIHDILAYLAVAVIALAASNLFSHYFSGIGRNHINFIGSTIGLAVTAGLGYWLIPEYGLKGAAMASSIAFAATTVFHWLVFSFSRSSDNKLSHE